MAFLRSSFSILSKLNPSLGGSAASLSAAALIRFQSSARPSCLPSDIIFGANSSLCHERAHASRGTTTGGIQAQLQHFRGLKVLRRTFPLPPSLETVVKKKLQEAKQSRETEAADIPPLAARAWQAGAVRVGCLAYKAGMTQDWDEHGVRVPLTALWVDDCQVVAVKTQGVDGYNALQIGAGYTQQRDLHPGLTGYYLKQGVPFKRCLFEFKVSPDALLPVGTPISAAHFVAGQHVDITGWTKWKGFQGVMKRWNFKGLPASHGVSVSHRAPGSIGNRADPGKVFKGKRMPGNLGDERVTVRGCLVYKVDPVRNLVFVRGQVPGPAGQAVLLRDAFSAQPQRQAAWQLPFPTYVPLAGAAKDAPTVSAGRISSKDPYRAYNEESDYFEVVWKKSD